jgi:acyl carrier protein
MTPEALPDLRLVVSAGEPCDPALARRWGQFVPMVNAYGPTEATIYATVGTLEADGAFPIGRPIANMRVYVLDRHGEPVPTGVAGEIHIGGIGVARGYLNQPELTAERFIPDTLSGRAGARLYRTGDLGRLDASGRLHYLGRADRQLKVRGYRIEPGEVETVLRSHPEVADAAVLGLGTGPDARLIAYVIPKAAPPLVVALRAFVASLLPDYMAPAAYVMVETWPKTPNGKVDHAALPRPASFSRETSAEFVSPATRTEQGIAAIWRDCLGLAEVGTDDNFFDLGGHSLLLVRVHGRLREAFRTTLSLVDLFRFPTIRLLAGAIETTTAGHDQTEALAQTRAGQRAALQTAARQQRRHRRGPTETTASNAGSFDPAVAQGSEAIIPAGGRGPGDRHG